MGDAGPSTPLPVLSQDQHESISSTAGAQVRDVHVLVTGFGPFKSFYINPSWLIASNLSETLDPEPVPKHSASSSDPIRPPNLYPYRIVVHTHPSAIRVSYGTVASTVPTLLSPAYNPSGINYDYILHIGLASGRDSYTLETIAHRDFYKIKDVDDMDGFIAGEFPWKKEGVPEHIEVGWNPEDVLRRWERIVSDEEDENEQALLETWEAHQKAYSMYSESIGGPGAAVARARQQKPPTEKRAVVKLSKDAGRFLCEFILMTSLTERWRDATQRSNHESNISDPAPTNNTSQDPREKLGKVAFLHVPNGIAVVDIARGKRVAEAAIRALVASWEAGYRNPQVYGAHDETQHLRPTPSGTTTEAFEARGTGDA